MTPEEFKKINNLSLQGMQPSIHRSSIPNGFEGTVFWGTDDHDLSNDDCDISGNSRFTHIYVEDGQFVIFNYAYYYEYIKTISIKKSNYLDLIEDVPSWCSGSLSSYYFTNLVLLTVGYTPFSIIDDFKDELAIKPITDNDNNLIELNDPYFDHLSALVNPILNRYNKLFFNISTDELVNDFVASFMEDIVNSFSYFSSSTLAIKFTKSSERFYDEDVFKLQKELLSTQLRVNQGRFFANVNSNHLNFDINQRGYFFKTYMLLVDEINHIIEKEVLELKKQNNIVG